MWLLPAPQRPQPSPETYPVRGIDISAHNGEVDFGRVADSGMEFVIMKATEGATFKDSRFGANYRAAREAGLKVGAYHFFRFDVDGSLQAMNLINSLNGRPLDLPVMIDIEEWTNPDDVSTPDILRRISGMVDHLQRSGYDVALYTNKDGHRRFIDNCFSDLPLWICSFTDPPSKRQWHPVAVRPPRSCRRHRRPGGPQRVQRTPRRLGTLARLGTATPLTVVQHHHAAYNITMRANVINS